MDADNTHTAPPETANSASGSPTGNTFAGEETPKHHVTGDEPLYVISVAAKLVQLPAWTLRVLDEQGIVSPKRTDKNRRLYSDKDLMRLARVRALTEDEGVNMNGVRLILRLEEEYELPLKEKTE
jgi:hypothetical protein